MYGMNWEKEESKNGPMATMDVSIDDAVFQKINHWVQKAPGEVSGLGKVIRQGNSLRIIDACLVKQQNAAAETELDPASVAKAMYEMRNTPGALNFWWHSHVNMGVFWSGTDIDTIREIGRHGFVVSTVFNKKREMLSSLYVKETEFVPEVFVNNLPTVVQSYIDAATVASWDSEYDAKCFQRSYTTAWDWRKNQANNGNYGSTALGIGNGTGYGGGADPYEGKYGNEGYAAPVSDDAPETINARTLSNTTPVADPSNCAQHSILLADKYLCEEIIEDWGEDMEAEPLHKEAQNILVLIILALQKLRESGDITQQVHLSLKQEYIERFNISRKTYREIAAAH